MKKLILIFAIILLHSTYLFSQEWSDPVQISTLEGVNNNSDFCIDNSGNIHCVWSYKVESNYKHIYYSKSIDDGQTWSEPENVSQNTSLWMENPHIVADSDNNLHLTYDYNSGNPYQTLIVHRKFMGNAWSEMDTVSSGWPGARHNRLLIDNNDKLYCFWFHDFQNGTTFYRVLENGVWDEIQIPYNNNDNVFLNNVVIDSLNNIYCIGNYFDEGQNPYDMRVIYFDFIDNEWSNLTQINDERSWGETDIALSNSNNQNIVWEQYINDSIPPDNGTLYSYYNGESWEIPELLAENAYEQAITIDLNNKTHIIDNEEFENGYRLVHYQFIDNEWVGEIIDVSNYGNYGNKLISREHYLYMTSVLVQSLSPDYNASVVLRKHEITTSIENILITVIDLYNIYPNPSTASTTISYSLKETKQTSIKIYDLQGKLINTILEKKQAPGKYQIMWNGTDNNGKEVKCGLYLVRLQAGRQFMTRPVEIIK